MIDPKGGGRDSTENHSSLLDELGDGQGHPGESPERKPQDTSHLGSDEETFKAETRPDESALDDDPRVRIGLDRFIDMLMNTPSQNSKIVRDDD